MKWTEAKKSGDNMHGQGIRERVGPMVLRACLFCTATMWVACSLSSPVVLDLAAETKQGEVGILDMVAVGDRKLDARMQDIREAEVVVDADTNAAGDADIPALPDTDTPDTADADTVSPVDVHDAHDTADVVEVETIDICVPDCTEAMCGDEDNCGGLCPGLCLGEQEECIEGVCLCLPDCEAKECGGDGCGGECGECAGPQDVCIEGACVCQPECEGKQCGEDGCSGECGDCPGPQDACVGGACECQPACEGMECGKDGCEGVCGDCEEYWECDSGICFYVPWCGDSECDVGEDCGDCPIDCSCCDPPCDSDLEECIQATTGDWACAAKMVEIPAGNFWMGCNNCAGSSVNDTSCYDREHPYHEVYLDAYEMDRTEVTAAQYLACKTAGGCTPAGTGSYATYEVPGKEDHPVNYVTWYQAEDYCLWTGKQLCTEAQWEKGARGGCEKNGGPSNCKAQSRKYPWGNETATCDLAVMSGCDGDTQPVCSRSPAGDSPYGLCDMAGNVWEWTADWYGSDYYCAGSGADTSSPWTDCTACGSWPGSPNAWSNPFGTISGSYRVSRGGSFDYFDYLLRVSFRGYGGPSVGSAYLGLRCCKTPEE